MSFESDSKTMAKVSLGPESPAWMVQGEVRRRIRQFGGGINKAERDEREKEREKEEKLEKARAAAWAWYQHGKGGKESVSSSSSSGSGASMYTVRHPVEVGHKSSRFKSEAMKTSGDHYFSPSAESTRHRRVDSGHRRTASGWSWDFSDESQIVVTKTSSLFDSYELDSVSKRIDAANLGPTLPNRPTGPGDSRPVIVPHGEGPSEIKPEAFGLPAPMRPPGASAPYRPEGLTMPRSLAAHQRVTIPHGFTTQERIALPQGVTVPRSPKVTRTSSHRKQFLPCGCGSISDAFSHEEISRALGIDIMKCDCPMVPAGHESDDISCLHLRRITRAIQEFMHLPEFEYHPQRKHHDRRHHHHLHLSHLRLYRSHDHKEYHHHLHYQIKLRDGVHHVRKAFGRSIGRSIAYWCFI